MSLGKLAYRYIFEPTLPIRYHLNHFGLNGWLRYRAGERAMVKAAPTASSIKLSNNENDLTFCFLTGERYWYQTIFAIKSLHLQLGSSFGVKIYSDGSLQQRHADYLLKFAPFIQIVSLTQVTDHLDDVLPTSKFPTLRYLREWHPFFRRLIDIHCNDGFAIHMDSDMLAFKKPDAIIGAFGNKKAIYMQDLLEQSYFVDTEENLAKKHDMQCLSYVNGGIVGYNGSTVDYTDLEQKAKILLDNYPNAGPAKIEQTLMSYVLFKQDAQGLDRSQYVIHYDSAITGSDDAVIKHYIFKAKLPYFTTEWKKVAR